MKHIVRLLVVLVIACGVGFLIFKVANNNAPFVLSEFAIKENASNKQFNENLDLLKEKFSTTSENYTKFCQFNEIYKSFDDTLNYYENILNGVSLSKNEIEDIKKGFNSVHERLNTLDVAVNSLISYLNTEEANPSQTNGREIKVNEEYKNVLKECLNLNLALENLIVSKVYNNKCLDPTMNLYVCKNLLVKCHFNSDFKNFGFLSSVQNKISDFVLNGENASDNLVKFVVLFGEFDKIDWQNRFIEYFQNNEVVESENKISVTDFNNLLDCLNKEAYYEKV